MADASVVLVFAVIAAGVRIALAVSRSQRDRDDRAPRDMRPDPSDPRWSDNPRPPQIAGKKCAQCAKKIMMVSEGEICGECDAPIHHDCQARHSAGHGPQAGPFR